MHVSTKHIAFALAALFVTLFPVAFGQSAETMGTETMNLEISEDATRFVFDESKTYDDGMPAHGSSFVTFGYVYPEGTLDGTNGVNEDGSAEFPEAVIGEWVCFGTMINDAGHASEGAWVISTQVVNLSGDLGAQSIVTTGYEFADDTPTARAISGGTGDYATARGQATQVLEGFNAAEGVVLSVTLEVATPAGATAVAPTN